jgi:general secretion pathway protein L
MKSAAFFSWWLSQLGELVPAPLRGSWHKTKTSVTLEISNDHCEISAPPGDMRASFSIPRQEDAPVPQEVGPFIANLRGAPQRIQLVLAPDDYLSTRLTLPRAARAHLAEAVRYQLPQLTPFSADQLLYACGESPNSASEGPLPIWLVAIPRAKIARTLSAIGQPLPENPLPLRSPPASGSSLSLSWPVAEGPTEPRRRVRMAWLGLVILCVAVLGVHYSKVQSERSTLQDMLSELRPEAREVRRLRDRLTAARAQAESLLERKQTSLSPLMLLDALTRQLGDDTWIQGLELNGQRLKLRGISSSPASVIEQLEALELLREVRFDTAITRDGRSQGDRFNISAQLVHQAGEQGS